MVAIGDVFSIVSIFLGLALSAWSLIIAMSLLFPGRVKRATDSLMEAPKKTFFRGVLMLVVLVVSFFMVAGPNPLGKLLGWPIMLFMLAVATMGAGAISRTIGTRIQEMSTKPLSDYEALLRGAGFMVVAGILPVLGWLAFAPVVLITALGAGTVALKSPRTVPAGMVESSL